MTSEEVLGFLADLAREAGLRVQPVSTPREGDPASHSGVCRVRDRVFVVLVRSDSLEDTNYGWTIEMQIKAVRARLELP